MYDVEVFFHIEPVRTARAVNFVAAVIHRKAYESVVFLITCFNQLAKLGKNMRVYTKVGESLDAFGSRLVHLCVIISVVYYDHIVTVLKDKLDRLCVYLCFGVILEIINVSFKINV